MTDAAPKPRLLTALATKQGHRDKIELNWAEIHRELNRKPVTLEILWDEYIERRSTATATRGFASLYRGWASRSRSQCGKPMRVAQRSVSLEFCTASRRRGCHR